MNEIMRPIQFDKLVNWMLTEYKEKGSIFGIRKEKFYKSTSGTNIQMFGDKITSPLGPAAGPNSQLSQNIVASYLSGARFMELKTVQIMDGEELRKCIARPCINIEDEGYNVEWSTELYVHEAMEEYIKGWFAVHFISKELGISEERDFAFNISLGYDLEGIKTEKIDNFVEGMKDATNTNIWNECKEYLLSNVDNFTNIDKEYIENISSSVSPSVTLSTLHGCPPEEIERIARYLLSEKKMHTYIKCNPTLLGYDFARNIMDSLGYDYLTFDDHHFKNDLQYADAIPMFNRLIEFSRENNLEFGLKLTNTFPVKIKRDELPGEEMYMSGRSLYPLTISLASKLATEFDGKLPLSYSGGADFFNIQEIIKTGIQPITVATTILKPGGYERFKQLSVRVESHLKGAFSGIDVDALKELAKNVASNKFHVKSTREVDSRKTDSKLDLYDCYKAPCKDGGCPIEQQIPEYLKLVSEEKYDEAFRVISIDNANPAITGTICDHQCQNKCTRLDYEKPLEIRYAKNLAVINAQDKFISNLKAISKKTDKKVAVIGAGAAGISTALFLRRNGVEVTVFEKRDRPFGIVEYVIPEFRIPTEMIKRDFEMAKKYGVEFRFNVREDYNIDELKKEYDFVVIATGSWNNGYNPFKDSKGKVLEALDFLEESKSKNLNVDLGKTVMVVGGGDVSMDCARAAIRAPGVEKVYLIYRRTKEVMPATPEEVKLAKEDNVEIIYLTSPISYDGKTVILEKNELVNNKAVSTGVRSELQVDSIINAIGTKVDTTHYKKNNITLSNKELPIINEHNETSIKNVYVAGDGKAGAATVVKAIADGKKITKDILEKLDLENDFVNYKLLQEQVTIYNKKGILRDSCKDSSDTERCLVCDQVCDICVDVCPNRANISLVAESELFSQKRQILHVDGMCNECGNCGIFCPHDGNPYKDKITLFWTMEDFECSKNVGFFKTSDSSFKVRTEDGSIVNYNLQDNNISDEMKVMIDALINDYSYLLD
ncbi:putative selenate reductase subunit YgfK [Mycoplasmatota bacterium]|nr:putative selenate reductase subunit YgfK [Mycoplasmatota bacterium]